MNRIIGIAPALVLLLLTFVPTASAAEPWDQDEHVVLSTGGAFTFTEGQHADLLVIIGGDATIEGNAKAVLVIDGTASFVGSRTTGLVAVSSHVTLDASSVVSGDVHTYNSTVDAPASAISGSIDDFGDELAGAWVLSDVARLVVYAGFVLALAFAAVVFAGLASRQVRQAEAVISREPVMTVVAAFAGILGIAAAGALAIVTVVGVPLGLGILVIGLPAMLVVGYLVAGIWVGDLVVARVSPGVVRERPYLAAAVGTIIIGVVSVLPVVGGLIGLVGFGAVVVVMWRTFRGQGTSAIAQAAPVPMAS